MKTLPTMSCDRCRYWTPVGRAVGQCAAFTDATITGGDAFVEERGVARSEAYAVVETPPDFFCAMFEGREGR